MNEILGAVVAVPSTLLVMAATAGATAQITQADPAAVQRAVYATGAVLIGTSAISGKVPVVIATSLAVAATVWIVRPIWFRGQNG